MRRVATFLMALLFAISCGLRASGQGERQLLPVLLKGKWGFIDGTGKLVVEPQFDALGGRGFSEGLMGFRVGRKWGYLDETGVIKIRPQFAETHPFSEGMAAVKVGDKWGFIDRSGKLVLPLEFDEASTFFDGIARVEVGDYRSGRSSERQKIGYVDTAGRYIWKPTN
jgi:hypothetical protein